MTNFKLRTTVAALAGIAMFGLVGAAHADSTDDLLKKLRDKGILTDQEYNQFNESRDNEQAQAASEKAAANKGKIKISKFIDNATIYGDIRARYEHRDGEDLQATSRNEDRDRGRYKLTVGIKTEASNFFYSDLALAMGNGGRSDNATFGRANAYGATGTAAGAPGSNTKETVFVKRALIGWHGVDWLTVEAGRVSNPLYTTPMVWDADLTFEGLTEQLNFTVGKVELFGNLVQTHYAGDSQQFNTGTDTSSSYMFAFQGGAKFKLTDELSAKVAMTYYTYTHDRTGGTFSPGLGNGTALVSGTGNALAYNDMRPIEIPFEVSYKASDKYTVTGFGDFVHNLDGDDRYNAAIASGAGNAAAIRAAGNDDNAWLLGIGIKSGKGVAGDWDAKIWYQDVGVYSVDPNGVDSDFMDSRVNMKGVVFKAGYNVEDNVVLNIAAGHASRKNDSLAAVGTGGDLGLNIDDYNLYQVDMTYKF